MKEYLSHVLWIMSTLQVAQGVDYCQSKFGFFHPDEFNLHACSWCYFFLYPDRIFKPYPHNHYLIRTMDHSNSSRYQMVAPDINNETSVSIVCSTLNSDECNRWKLCCSLSRTCCRRQLQSTHEYVNSTCPMTWDGFSCWEEGVPGQNSHVSCPIFLPYAVPTRSAIKTCEKDGKWLQRQGHGWTDYTPCLSYQELKVAIYISIVCQVVSLLCLVPSVSIFVKFSSLRSQHRIRLHANFFISFILSGICSILWNSTVTLDRLTNNNVSDTLMFRNTGGCKFLSFLTLYFTSTNYVWMFCEGIYLFRLIVNAFSPPKRLLPLYIFGWGTPLVYTGIYAIVRYFQANESCWAKSMGDKEWIIYAPNLLCLVANIFFLCSILRILLTQLQSHPNEPSHFRRALKATFVLIPLFGVQLIVTIYRVPPEAPGALHYERFSEFIINSQGMFVAVIFCLCNGEVISLLKNSIKRRKNLRNFGSKKEYNGASFSMNNSVATRYHSISEKNSPARTILLSHLKQNGDVANV